MHVFVEVFERFVVHFGTGIAQRTATAQEAVPARGRAAPPELLDDASSAPVHAPLLQIPHLVQIREAMGNIQFGRVPKRIRLMDAMASCRQTGGEKSKKSKKSKKGRKEGHERREKDRTGETRQSITQEWLIG